MEIPAGERRLQPIDSSTCTGFCMVDELQLGILGPVGAVGDRFTVSARDLPCRGGSIWLMSKTPDQIVAVIPDIGSFQRKAAREGVLQSHGPDPDIGRSQIPERRQGWGKAPRSGHQCTLPQPRSEGILWSRQSPVELRAVEI